LNIYGDAGGPGGILSINYDRRFTGEKGLGFRAGIGACLLTTTSPDFIEETKLHPTFPLELNYLAGKAGHYAEFGAGMTFLGNMNNTVSEKGEVTITPDLIWHVSLGYRYQPLTRGLTTRVFLSPMVTAYSSIFFYGGVSFGLRF